MLFPPGNYYVRPGPAIEIVAEQAHDEQHTFNSQSAETDDATRSDPSTTLMKHVAVPYALGAFFPSDFAAERTNGCP